VLWRGNMKFVIQPLSEHDANHIATWQYETPYSIYNPSTKDIPALLDPSNRYYSVQHESGRLFGYCCFGKDATVPGGEYTVSEPDVVDVGLGMNPELVGKGLGKVYVEAILQFAATAFEPSRFRVSIAEFNLRSQSTFLGLGFVKTNSFSREGDGMKFVQLQRALEPE